jgi:hypothetical protein
MMRLVRILAVLFKKDGICDDRVVVIDLVFSSESNFMPVLFSILSENIWTPCITSCWLLNNDPTFGETIKTEK